MAPDPYADIDFDEINEATSLAHDEIKCLKVLLGNVNIIIIDTKSKHVTRELVSSKKFTFGTFSPISSGLL